MQLEPNTENNPVYNYSNKAYFTLMNLLYYTTFFGVTALTVGRFLAINLHLRYQELVTHKRVVAAVILMWVFGPILSLIDLLVIALKDRFAFLQLLRYFVS